jgi:hypothetical protein
MFPCLVPLPARRERIDRTGAAYNVVRVGDNEVPSPTRVPFVKPRARESRPGPESR